MATVTRVLVAGAAVLLATACGPVEQRTGGSPADTAAPIDATALAAADLQRGEALSLACQACHHLDPSAGHHIGPNLAGVFGRPAASVDGFEYSDALAQSDIVWGPETIDAWLLDPIGFVPDSSMAFFGYRSASDRRDLIAYLLQATAADGSAR